MLTDSAANSELKANCEKFDSEFENLERRVVVCQVAWRFGRAPKDWQIDHLHTQKGRQEWMNQLPRHLFG